MAYSRDEQETTCVYDSVTDKWTVYSACRRHITRLLKIGGEPVWKEEELGSTGELRIVAARWVLGGKQVRFAKLWAGATKEADGEGEHDEICGD